MPDLATLVHYFHISLPRKTGDAARVLDLLRDAGVNLMGVCTFPRGARRSQMDLIAEDSAALQRVAAEAGLALSDSKQAFVIQGEDRPGAVAAVLSTLAAANIRMISIQAVSSGNGAYGAMVWVEDADVESAERALGAVPATITGMPGEDPVDLASAMSFPASDPPPWT